MDAPVRMIPRLDIKGPNLVKGIHLEGLRVLGRPEEFARYYYEQGADELFYMDVVASLYNRNSLHEIVARTAREIFIPLTVGGGLRSLEDIRAVLAAGADKVSLNTAAIRDPELIRRAALRFGSSTIVVAVEAIRESDGVYRAFVDNGREATGLRVEDWVVRAVELGAGEICITSVDREGTGQGFDLELVQRIAARVDVPVIAHGGAARPEHVADVVLKGGATAVAMASVLHYGVLASERFERRLDGPEGNTSFLASGKGSRKIPGMELRELKERVQKLGVPVRLPPVIAPAAAGPSADPRGAA